MIVPDIPFDFHDSTIVSISIGPGREVAFSIDLYPIFYPPKPRVTVHCNGIKNYEVIERYAKRIIDEADDQYIGCRINVINYDTKRVSRKNDYWIFLDTEWLVIMVPHGQSVSTIQEWKCLPI